MPEAVPASGRVRNFESMWTRKYGFPRPLVASFVGWLKDWFNEMADRLVCWQVVCVFGWLTGWLVAG